MDKYEPSMIVLDGGLDLQMAKLAVPKGRLNDCLNHEVVDRSGYKRIDGFERFDGHESPSDPYVLRLLGGSRVGATLANIAVGDSLVIDGTTDIFGVVTSLTTAFPGPAPPGSTFYTVYYALVNEAYEPGNGDDVNVLGQATGNSINIFNALYVPQDTDTVPISLTAANALANVRRSLIEALPQQPIGLHWFRDSLYAVVDEDVIGFTSGGTTELFVNDIIVDSGGNEARIVKINLASGTWAGGNAAGTLEIHRIDRTGFTSGNVDLTRPTAGTTSNVFTLAATSNSATTAGLWKSMTAVQAAAAGGDAVEGWNKVDTGLLIGFENGSFNSPDLPRLNRYTNEVTEEFESGDTDVTGSNGVFETAYPNFIFDGEASADASTFAEVRSPAGGPYTGVSSTPESIVVALADAEDDTFTGTAPVPVSPGEALVFRAAMSDLGGTKITPRVGVTKLNTVTSIPVYARIVGVEVYLDNVKCNPEADAGDWFGTMDLEVCLFKKEKDSYIKLGTSKNSILSNENGVGLLDEDITLGGSTDIWGNAELGVNDVVDAGFGVSLRSTMTVTPGVDSAGFVRNVSLSLDRVRVKIYWESQFTKYFFWDGADDVKGDLISYRVLEGDLLLGTASGFMQIANVAPEGSAARRSIKAGDEVHLAAGGASGTLVAEVTSVEYNSLDSLQSILQNSSRYQFITANFYGDEDWDGVYGVSGAGRAFTFDEQYFTRIFQQPEEEKDKPRHVAYHFNHLALGLRSGVVHFSRVGYPEEFSVEQDALEGEDLSFPLSIGDRITGLLPLPGEMLGVFCERSIHGVIGTTRDTFEPKRLVPKSGAIEYSVAASGTNICFCNNYGIYSLSQTERYGSFLGVPMSANVTSWLKRRLKKYPIDPAAKLRPFYEYSLVTAVPFPAQNQIKYFFGNGEVLTMTLVGPDQSPQFTIQQYYVGASSVSDRTRFLVPIAWSSETDDNGEQRIHMAHYSELSDVSAADAKYVYEMNKGWSFDGKFIPAYFTTSWLYSNPNSNFNMRRVIVDGLSYGNCNIELTTARDLSDNFSTTRSIVSLPRTAEDTLSDDLVPYFTAASQAERGRAIALKFTCVGQNNINIPEPPYILQVLVLNETSNLSDIK